MGIKGIYQEIGPGERIALSKLAALHFEEHGRPLRIAIDTSIWLFQIQAGKGGSNPAVRTFFYRCLRLMSLAIQPLFVWDGPNKPPFKRSKKTGTHVVSVPDFLAKQLLEAFGFPSHHAPGEAEAECALLQREGIVDMVLSEDVDTLMFGSGATLRNWSAEGSTGKTPTHVNLYRASTTKETSGLDREGMILVGIMSGGDYIPEGIPGCGPKTACEAARAGYGAELCRLSAVDAHGVEEWRSRLIQDLRENKDKHFRIKHKKLEIPDDFPRMDILRYYTHPVISGPKRLADLRASLSWDKAIDAVELRKFCGDAFDWKYITGAKHFIRNMAPAILTRQISARASRKELLSDDLEAVAEDERQFVDKIHGLRAHKSADNARQLRIGYVPSQFVAIDLDNEEPDPMDEINEANKADSDDEGVEGGSDGEGKPKKDFDPHKAHRMWVMEVYVKLGVPLKYQDWEGTMRAKEVATQQKAEKAASRLAATSKKKQPAMPPGSLDRFTKVMKPGINRSSKSKSITPEPFSSTMPARKERSQFSRTQSLQTAASTASYVSLLSSPEPPRSSPEPIEALDLSGLDAVAVARKRRYEDSPQKPFFVAPAAGVIDSLADSSRAERVRLDAGNTSRSPAPHLGIDGAVEGSITPAARTPGNRRKMTKTASFVEPITISSSPSTPKRGQATITDWMRRSQSVTPALSKKTYALSAVERAERDTTPSPVRPSATAIKVAQSESDKGSGNADNGSNAPGLNDLTIFRVELPTVDLTGSPQRVSPRKAYRESPAPARRSPRNHAASKQTVSKRAIIPDTAPSGRWMTKEYQVSAALEVDSLDLTGDGDIVPIVKAVSKVSTVTTTEVEEETVSRPSVLDFFVSTKSRARKDPLHANGSSANLQPDKPAKTKKSPKKPKKSDPCRPKAYRESGVEILDLTQDE